MTVLSLAPEDAIQTRTQCQRHGVMLRRWHDRTRRSQWVRTTHECDFETSIDKYGEHERYQQQNNPVAMDHASFVWTPCMEVSYRGSNRMGQRLEGKVRSDYNVKRAQQ
jgi:hypothetical protein